MDETQPVEFKDLKHFKLELARSMKFTFSEVNAIFWDSLFIFLCRKKSGQQLDSSEI